MNKYTYLLLLVTSIYLPLSHATPADISWSDADDYRDLRSVTEKRSAIQQRFFKEITKHVNELTQALPHGYKLTMDVTNVDLAGHIEFVNGQRIRVVKDMFYPNMTFNYKLLDQNGQLVKGNEETIKGMNFLLNSKRRNHNEAFYFEKKMITDWFNKTFSEVIKA